MRRPRSRFVLQALALSACLPIALPAVGSAQSSNVGLSTVRAQRFGNENLLGFYTPQSGDAFGISVAVGDFNGDGADDLATGAPFDNGIPGRDVKDSGSVFVRYGKAVDGLATNLAGTVLRQTPAHDPAEVDDHFGFSLAACDFNGDGSDDLAVGLPDEDYLGHHDAGAVEIHYGSPAGIHTSADSFYAQSTPGITGDVEDNDRFGHSLACGDFNHDGFADLVIGVPEENQGSIGVDFDEGMIEIIPGSASGLVPTSSTHLDQGVAGMAGSPETGDQFGWALAAGDFNGDLFDDLAIGVPGENDQQGYVQVVFGGPSGLTPAGNLLFNESALGGTSHSEDRFGSVLAAGDFDGDGHDDLAIGIPLKDVGPTPIQDAGMVDVAFGAAGGFDHLRVASFTEDVIYGSSGNSEVGDELGVSLAVGDFDHDGRADLAIGHPNEAVAGAADGAVTLLMGGPGGLTAGRRRTIYDGIEGFPGNASQQSKLFGYALASGDFDADRHADLVSTVPLWDEGGLADVGAESVLYGALFADGVETGNTSLWPQTVSSLYANKILVTPAAKLGPPSSNVGLEVDLFAPTVLRPATATYVRVGPEAGFHDERRLSGTFFIDPQGLAVNVGNNIFSIMRFTDRTAAIPKARLSFDLMRTATAWALVASNLNDASGVLEFAASGTIATPGDPNGHNNRIDFTWTAGSPGHLTVWLTRFVGGGPDARGRVQLFSVDLPGAGTAVIDHVFAGMVFGQKAGTSGKLFLDELSFRR